MQTPCKNCISYAICLNKKKIKCSLLEQYIKNKHQYFRVISTSMQSIFTIFEQPSYWININLNLKSITFHQYLKHTYRAYNNITLNEIMEVI